MSATFITASSLPMGRPIRSASFPTSSRKAPCASKSPRRKLRARSVSRARFPAFAAPPSSGNPFMRSLRTIAILTSSATSFRNKILPSQRFARSLLASRMSSSNSPTSIKRCWRPLVRNIFRGFGAVFYKEALHVRRDAGTLFFSLTMPLLQMFLLGYGVDTNIRQINTVVYNADGRRESRELIDRLKNSDTFHILNYVQNDHDLNDLIISGKTRVGIKIPIDKDEDLRAHIVEQAVGGIDGDFDADARLAGDDQIVQVVIILNVVEDVKGVGVL